MIKVKFISLPLPDPDACFSVMKLPTDHEAFNVFAKNMNVAINSQHSGFGRGNLMAILDEELPNGYF